MKFVDMNQAAFDAQGIVFPGLGNCHGVVYVTDQGLFGYHIYGAPGDSAEKATLFAAFVKGHTLGRLARGSALCGGSPKNRYLNGADTQPEQAAELRLFAQALGFNGQLWGATWDTAALGWRTTYCAVSNTMITEPLVGMRIENFTGQDLHNATGAPASAFDHKQMTIRKANGYIGSAVLSSSTKAPNTVITGVTRLAGTPSVMVALNRLP